MSERTPSEILDEPIDDGDIQARIAEAGRPASKVTIGLVIAALMVLAFGAGVWARSGLDNRPGPVRDGGAGNTVLTGTVQSASSSGVRVAGDSGKTTTVSLPEGSRVFVARNGSRSELNPGAQVRVEGSGSADGRFTAERLTVQG